jgi:hypothetical protein
VRGGTIVFDTEVFMYLFSLVIKYASSPSSMEYSMVLITKDGRKNHTSRNIRAGGRGEILV